MRLVICMLMLLIVNSVYAKDSFVYNAHGKRDPFMPLVSSSGVVVTYDQDLSLTDLVLEGIMADDSGDNAAVVNGKVVKLKDKIGPYIVDIIAKDHVEFLRGTERLMLKIKHGDNA